MATKLAENFTLNFSLAYFGNSLSEEENARMTELIGIRFEDLAKFNAEITEAECNQILMKLNEYPNSFWQNESYLNDIFKSCCIISILKQSPVKYDLVLEIIRGISNKSLIRSIEKNLAVSTGFEELWNKEYSKDEILERVEVFSKCGLLMSDQSAIVDLKNNLYVATSDKMDTLSLNLQFVTQDLKSLISTATFHYEVVKELVERYFELIKYNLQFNKLPYKIDELYVMLEEKDIAKCLLDLELFPFNDEHKAKYNEFLAIYNDHIQILKSEITLNKCTNDISEYYNKIQIKDALDMDLSSLRNELPIKNLSQLILEEIDVIYPGNNNVHVVSAKYQNQRVAIKFFKHFNLSKTSESLQNQSKVMYMMSQDPGFIKIYGALIDTIPEIIKNRLSVSSKDEYGIIIMEYCNYDLKKYMTLIQDKSRREQLTLEFGKILIKSMKRLNNKGIKHKDIKPQNILVLVIDGTPYIKIADFDVSTAYQKLGERTITCKTNVVGTLIYASPELRILLESKQEKKKKALFNSNKADVYSLGITLFEVAVLPKANIDLNKASDAQTLQMNINVLIENMIENEELKSLLRKLLVVNPAERWSFRNFPNDDMVINEATVKFEFEDEEDEYIDEDEF